MIKLGNYPSSLSFSIFKLQDSASLSPPFFVLFQAAAAAGQISETAL
jgi:hypothetical protein